jgi:AcrR family transcriptional regulator
MSQNETKIKILDTAIQVSVADGIKGLTIDNVAKAAHMSKGGVFYHFKSKEELLEAMVNHIIDQFEQEAMALQEQGMDPLTATIESSLSGSPDQHNRICAMVAAVAHDRTIPSRTSWRFEDWITELQQAGVNRGTALLVTHAIDGFFITSAFEMCDDIERDRIELKRRLLQVVQEDVQYWYVQAFRHAVKMVESEPQLELVTSRN